MYRGDSGTDIVCVDLRSTTLLYHLHDYQRALFSPAMQFAQVTARMFSSPGSWLSHLPGAARVAAVVRALLPARQALRETAVRDRDRRRARRPRRRPRRDRADAAVLPPAAVHPPQRRSRGRGPPARRFTGAGGGAALRSPLDAAARDGRDAAHATRRLRHRLGRRPPGAGRRGRLHAGRLRRLRPRVHAAPRRGESARAGGLPAGRSRAGGGGAGRGRGRAGAAQRGPDGRADRFAPQPDPGQPPRHQQAAALVRDQPAPRGPARLSGPRAGASIPASCSTPASSR